SSGGQMPPDVAQEIHTVIMTNCIPEAVLLARELRLPPPIPIPQVNAPQQPGKPAKGRSPEIASSSDSVPRFGEPSISARPRYMTSRQIPIEIPWRRPTHAKDARIPTAPHTTNRTGQSRRERMEPCRQPRPSKATAQTPTGTRTSETKSATAVRPRDTSSHVSACRNNLRGDMASPGISDHLMWSRLKDPTLTLDFVYVYRIQPRLCTSQIPLMLRNDLSCSTLNSMLPSMREPSIWISCSSCIPFSIT